MRGRERVLEEEEIGFDFEIWPDPIRPSLLVLIGYFAVPSAFLSLHLTQLHAELLVSLCFAPTCLNSAAPGGHGRNAAGREARRPARYRASSWEGRGLAQQCARLTYRLVVRAASVSGRRVAPLSR